MALDEYALSEMEDELIMLWRNEAAVIIGANQNAADEIDMDFVRERGIVVARRMSGGGAVFHDMGNVNFTVVSAAAGDFNNYGKFTEPIIGCLAELGVKAEFAGRNDLEIDGMKFCGNAQAMRRGRIMHHGCILYSADTSRLAGALKPKDAKMRGHGVKSVRKRVTNIADHMAQAMPVEDFIRTLADYFARRVPDIRPYALTQDDIARAEALMRGKYAAWEWIFGKSPKYDARRELRLPFGTVDIRLSVERGVIAGAKIYGDFFGMEDKGELEARLIGSRHDENSLRAALSETDVSAYISGMTKDELIGLIRP
jgi:lipoate-protein ligase A